MTDNSMPACFFSQKIDLKMGKKNVFYNNNWLCNI